MVAGKKKKKKEEGKIPYLIVNLVSTCFYPLNSHNYSVICSLAFKHSVSPVPEVSDKMERLYAIYSLECMSHDNFQIILHYSSSPPSWVVFSFSLVAWLVCWMAVWAMLSAGVNVWMRGWVQEECTCAYWEGERLRSGWHINFWKCEWGLECISLALGSGAKRTWKHG